MTNSNIDDLSDAIMDGDLATVKAFLEKGVDLLEKNEVGDLPLPWAVKAGHIDIIRALLAANPPLETRAEAEYTGDIEGGCTPLLDLPGVLHDHGVDVLRALVEAGADMNAQDDRGFNFVMLSICESPGCSELVQAAVDHGVDVDRPDAAGVSPLARARALFRRLSEADWVDEAQSEAEEIVEGLEALVEEGTAFVNEPVGGADVGRFGPGRSRDGLERTIEILENAGASEHGARELALVNAVTDEDAGRVRDLLAQEATVDFLDLHAECTPLTKAAGNKASQLVELLLDAGADVNLADPHGYTALMKASESGCAASVHVLLEAGADASIDQDGLTARAMAANADIRGLIPRATDSVRKKKSVTLHATGTSGKVTRGGSDSQIEGTSTIDG